MTALAAPSYAPDARRSGYRTGSRPRVVALVAALLLHAAFVALVLWRGEGFADVPGQDGFRRGELAVFALPSADDAAKPKEGGGDGTHLADLQPLGDRDAPGERAGSGPGDAQGAALLGDELARALADDPVSGGGQANYETILRRHIAAHSHAPTDDRGRRYTGTVVVRFRVARDGAIVDARVLQSRGAQLDEAALAALWRSEPLPRVPDRFDAPLEVDVPIDFRMRG
jgi:TonB family protein